MTCLNPRRHNNRQGVNTTERPAKTLQQHYKITSLSLPDSPQVSCCWPGYFCRCDGWKSTIFSIFFFTDTFSRSSRHFLPKLPNWWCFKIKEIAPGFFITYLLYIHKTCSWWKYDIQTGSLYSEDIVEFNHTYTYCQNTKYNINIIATK